MTLILEAALAAALAAAFAAWRRSLSLRRSLDRFTLEAEARQETFQRQLEESSTDRTRLSTILANIVEGVAAVDSDLHVIAANPAMLSLFGVKKEEAHGKPFLEALRHPRLNELLSTVIKERRSVVEEVSVSAPQERLFEAHLVPLLENGRDVGALLVLHDITRLRRLERMRRDFVANVSHELRTPLASIRGMAETLRDGAIEDEAHRLEFVEDIEKDAVRLTALVDDLLDLSAIESGHRRPLKIPLSVFAVAREAAASLKALLQRGKIELRFKETPGIPEICADPSQLKQVFTNLLNNSLKYNREGGSVTVSASADGAALRVSIKDTGYGIPKEDLPRIFERFYRVDKARSRELGGTGLGLSIVKHIVEGHGGTVGVDSEPDRGSTFFFTLPL